MKGKKLTSKSPVLLGLKYNNKVKGNIKRNKITNPLSNFL